MGSKLFHRRQSVYAIVLMVLLFLTLVMVTQNSEAEGIGDYPPPDEGDWVIRNETHVHDEIFIINGNISVLRNATLVLNNVTILINSSLGHPHGIYVHWRGTLNIHNSNITALYGPYVFQIDGNMTIENSKISRVTGGISINYGDVLIANSTIFNNSDYGIQCNGSPILENNTIYSNHGGIIISWGGAPLLYNNTISDNVWGVVCLVSGYATMFGNEISNNTLGGINVELGHFKIHNNTIASNGGFGIRSDHATINATNNTIYDNERWGIYSLGAPIFQENNIFLKDGKYNGEGDVLQEWEVLIKIFDANNEALDNVTLTIYDSLDNFIWSGKTIGNIRTVILREYELHNDGNELVHTPFTIDASKGNSINSTVVDVGDNMEIIIILDYEENALKREYKFPLWGLVVVSAIWLFALIMVIVGLFVAMHEKKRGHS